MLRWQLTLAAIVRGDCFEDFSYPGRIAKKRLVPMSPDKLVMMANQIGKFFVSQGRDNASAGIADHLKKFWDPKMRASLIAHWREGGEGLDPEVCGAVALLTARQPHSGQVVSQGGLNGRAPSVGFWPLGKIGAALASLTAPLDRRRRASHRRED
jgi:formate dehydrogenase subunit delta